MSLELILATEDELSEAVAHRLVLEQSPKLLIQQSLFRNGSGYLRNRLDNFVRRARHQPVLLLTDLDRKLCPSALINEWRGTRCLPSNLLFRVVVRTTEAWLLADREGLSDFLSLGSGKYPTTPENLMHPKRELIGICRRSKPKELRNDLIPGPGSTAPVGLGYNLHLTRFVRDHWNPARAAENAPSLARTRRRLAELAATAP